MSLTLLVAGSLAVAPTQAGAGVSTPADCTHPVAPPGFHHELVVAIRASRNLPPSWANSPFLAKIVCWQDTGFDERYLAVGHGQRWHGIFAMTVEEMKTIAGPWHSNSRSELILRVPCLLHGWSVCPHTAANTSTTQQLIAGLRWIWWMYGRPSSAWRFIVGTGRFDSLPRPGTDDVPTRRPFSVCPVAGVVDYRDDFGIFRGTGGYHPHSGNDMHAPIGRVVRAPFDGFAVAHTDTWFAGRSVSLVGAKGFARSAHLRRFGHLGDVHAGAVIGYVGQTGDALTPHDHFEWHPWVRPSPLHAAPSGFRRVLDAIDPFPFLNQVCNRG